MPGKVARASRAIAVAQHYVSASLARHAGRHGTADRVHRVAIEMVDHTVRSMGLVQQLLQGLLVGFEVVRNAVFHNSHAERRGIDRFTIVE